MTTTNGDSGITVREGLSVPDTGYHLRHAAEYAIEHHFEDFVIVDVDCHHYEGNSFAKIASYMEDEPIKRKLLLLSSKRESRNVNGDGLPASSDRTPTFNHSGATQLWDADQPMAGRIKRYGWRGTDPLEDNGESPDVQLTHRYMDQMGIDYSVVFPGSMLNLAVTPLVEVEVELARAYARWIVEDVAPFTDRLLGFLYLPFNDVTASLKIVQQYGSHPGVAGFVVLTTSRRAIHHNEFMPIFSAIEESGKPLAFHAVYDWGHGQITQLNKFISTHALSFPFNNMIHLANFIFNGIPERFPGLKTIWIEGGLAYVAFLMQRFDNEYMMRSSEAPLLKKLPSEYMREFYWSSQPMEMTGNRDILAATFEYIGAGTQLLYSSDYPHWDMDTPSSIYDLPFISEETKRAILGGNSLKLFNIKSPKKLARPRVDYKISTSRLV